jgi:hypothetical protein
MEKITKGMKNQNMKLSLLKCFQIQKTGGYYLCIIFNFLTELSSVPSDGKILIIIQSYLSYTATGF